MKTYLKDLTPEEVIRRFKAGEVAKNSLNQEVFIIDGVFCERVKDNKFNINISLFHCENFYFETPDELKPEVGKCYKTRDGRKAFISYVAKDDEMCFGCIQDDNTVTSWHKNGSFFAEEIDNLDLISEWSDDDVAED